MTGAVIDVMVLSIIVHFIIATKCYSAFIIAFDLVVHRYEYAPDFFATMPFILYL